MADDGFAVVEEELVASVTVRFLVGLLMDAGSVESIDLGSGYGQQDGGVGDDDVLGAFSRHLHDFGKQCQLPVGRKRGFRFVHDEQSFAEGQDEIQEALSVRLLVQRLLPVHGA